VSTPAGHQDGHVRPGAHDMAARIRGLYQHWATDDLRGLLRETGHDLAYEQGMSAPNRQHTELRAEVLKVMIAVREAAVERDAAAEGEACGVPGRAVPQSAEL
jgi:hypothetical protein